MILNSSAPGLAQQKLSISVRLLFGIYALNYIADIAHNDLLPNNVLLDFSAHAFQKICYTSTDGTVKSMIVPSYGIKPLICDFGMATRCSSTFNMTDDYELAMIHIDGAMPDWYNKPLERTKRGVVIATCERLAGQLMSLDPQCTADATDCNTIVLDLTEDVDKPASCFVC